MKIIYLIINILTITFLEAQIQREAILKDIKIIIIQINVILCLNKRKLRFYDDWGCYKFVGLCLLILKKRSLMCLNPLKGVKGYEE